MSNYKQSANSRRAAVSGHNIYQDKHGQNILYVPSTKCGYVIREKDTGGFSLYHNRLPIAIAVVMLGLSFNVDWRLMLLIGIVFYALLEWRFRASFLPSLTCITNFKPEKKRSRIQSLIEESNSMRTLSLAAAYLALGILMVINGYQIGASAWMLVCDYIVLVFCVYMFAQYIYAFFKIIAKK
ncbi:MAG: hypothetical protein EOM64_06045 [Erysipelotrichia bacterium]|nr:hypothetical protein [Erysipelotrichia bacterium]